MNISTLNEDKDEFLAPSYSAGDLGRLKKNSVSSSDSMLSSSDIIYTNPVVKSSMASLPTANKDDPDIMEIYEIEPETPVTNSNQEKEPVSIVY